MKMLITALLVASPLISFAGDQASNGLSYNYVGIGYAAADYDNDGASFKLKGYGIEASGLITENIFLVGDLFNASTKKIKVDGTTYSIDLDYTAYELGLGYRMPISNGTDVYGIVSRHNQKLKANGENVSDTNNAFTIGIKTLLADSVELDASGGALDGDFRGKLSLQYKVASNVGFVASYSTMRDGSQYQFGVRYLY